MGTLPQFLSPRDAQRQKEADAQMAGAVGGILAYRRQQQAPQLPSMDPAALQPVPSSLPTVPGPAPMGMSAPPMGAPGMAPPAPPMGAPPAPMGMGAPMGAPPMGGAPSLPPGLNLPPMPPMGGAPAMLAAGGTPSGPFPPEAMQGDPMFANMPQGGNMPPSDLSIDNDPAAWGVITADKLVPLMQQFLAQDGGELPDEDMEPLKPPPSDFMRWLRGGQSSDPFGQMLIDMYRDDPSPETAAELFAMLQDEARADPESVPRELIGVPGIRIRADLPSPTEAKERALSRIAA